MGQKYGSGRKIFLPHIFLPLLNPEVWFAQPSFIPLPFSCPHLSKMGGRKIGSEIWFRSQDLSAIHFPASSQPGVFLPADLFHSPAILLPRLVRWEAERCGSEYGSGRKIFLPHIFLPLLKPEIWFIADLFHALAILLLT